MVIEYLYSLGRDTVARTPIYILSVAPGSSFWLYISKQLSIKTFWAYGNISILGRGRHRHLDVRASIKMFETIRQGLVLISVSACLTTPRESTIVGYITAVAIQFLLSTQA